jgi:hypothetical protein
VPRPCSGQYCYEALDHARSLGEGCTVFECDVGMYGCGPDGAPYRLPEVSLVRECRSCISV